MTEIREIADSMLKKHGTPVVTSHSAACAWITSVWPDWPTEFSLTIRDCVANLILARSWARQFKIEAAEELYEAVRTFVEACGGNPPDFLKKAFALAENAMVKAEGRE